MALGEACKEKEEGEVQKMMKHLEVVARKFVQEKICCN